MAKGYDLKAGQGFQQPFVIAGQSSQAGDRGETALAPQRHDNRTKSFLTLGRLTMSNCMSCSAAPRAGFAAAECHIQARNERVQAIQR